MMIHPVLFNPTLVLGLIILSLAYFQSRPQASAAPIPPLLSRQAPHTYNNTFFPYDITGPLSPSLYKPGQVLDRCTKANAYAISFDDGPGQLTDELLDALEEQNLQVTFFMNGDNWSCIYRPETQRLLRRAYNAQHQIAAHPWSHRDLDTLSNDEIRQEMLRIEDAFRQILGAVPRYMRPPYGQHGERVRRVLENMGYIIVLWDVDRFPSDEETSPEAFQDAWASESNNNQAEKPMTGTRQHHRHLHHHHAHNSPNALLEEEEEESEMSALSFNNKWAEAVRGVPSIKPLDRDALIMGGIYQEATPIWAVESVQSLGYDLMPVARCLGDDDPRLWYKEVVAPATMEDMPGYCHL
ncbi:Carbohydrate esterase 4 protein [Linnemannia gamsii]|uniref:Carbohydrate esterase 4 protein n=1 Tax=Linnemannia gamsii TaxID=64522 RepID=A0A9P6R4D9_9FUNG|nr:Carbohydrate esterase 4 protein [Linnemannia gamsii]